MTFFIMLYMFGCLEAMQMEMNKTYHYQPEDSRRLTWKNSIP